MTIEVSGDIERVIQAAIASRRFANAEEFVSEMAELWQDRERRHAIRAHGPGAPRSVALPRGRRGG